MPLLPLHEPVSDVPLSVPVQGELPVSEPLNETLLPLMLPVAEPPVHESVMLQPFCAIVHVSFEHPVTAHVPLALLQPELPPDEHARSTATDGTSSTASRRPK